MQRVKDVLKALAANDYVRRIFHTFWQAAGGTLLAGLLAARSSADVKLAAAAALTVGLAAVKNLIVAQRS